ncbi:MAG: MarR family transcriptional regulator [Thermoplasmata archaeon]|nr:MarR family transcriptional regulator [Thermoplasmata archaeon]
MHAPLRTPRAPPVALEPEDLMSSVHEVMGSVLRRLAPTLEEEGITLGQFWALHLVSSLGQTSLTSVARHLSVAPPTVCGNVDQLVRSGFVSRHRSEQDRRAVELTLTPSGRRLEARIWRAVGQVMRSATDELSGEDVATATRVFRELRIRLERPSVELRREAS